MPRLTRDGKIVVRNGLSVQQSCIAACCDVVPPGDCCLTAGSYCGKSFSVCVTEYEYQRRETSSTVLQEVFSNPPSGQCFQPIPGGCGYTLIQSTTRDAAMVGGPYRMPFIPERCAVDGVIPVDHTDTNITEYSYTGGCLRRDCPEEDSRTQYRRCERFSQTCEPSSGGEQTGRFNPSNPIFGFRLSGWNVGDPDSLRLIDGTAETRTPNQCNGVTWPDTVQTVSISRRWVTGVGDNYYIAERTVTLTEPYIVALNTTACPPGFFFGNRVTTITETSTVRWRLTVTEDCNGATFPPCSGSDTSDCVGQFEYIRAEPCVGQINAPPVVFRAVNVEQCRTVPVGGFCYRIEPGFERTNDPTGSIVDERIVNEDLGFSTCCACLADCGGTTLSPYPCWQNFARSPDGTPIITPADIDPDQCCCNDRDIITIAQADNSYTIFGQRQEWRLQGVPLSFRRDLVNAVPGAELRSDVTIFDADTGAVVGGFVYNHGQFLNQPPMGCQWDQLGAVAFQFATPQNGVLSAPLGVNGLLPCPSDPGGVLGPWRLDLWSVSARCRTFSFQANWTNTGNGATYSARGLFNVTPPPEAELQRCGGGCSGGSGGGSASVFAPGDIRRIIGG